MKKKTATLLCLTFVISLLAGCTGKSAPTEITAATTLTVTEATEDTTAGMVKTGLSITTDLSESKNAAGDTAGQAKYDVSIVAVTVSDEGVIESCIIDSIPATVKFDGSGVISSDITADVLSKNELGEQYGLKAYANSKHEWNEQAGALAKYAEGKTVEELRNGALDETGHAADADLASTASIYLGSFVDAIEAAVNNAQHLGAQSGDTLKLAAVTSLSGSKDASAEKDGYAQLYTYITAMTMNDDIISSCYIDSLQAKVAFDATGTISTDLTAPVQSKNELGEDYGLKAYANSKHEWNEQAAAFAAYVTGKTAADVAGIAVNEKTAPTEADLAATVTISIGEFQALIAKAAAQ